MSLKANNDAIERIETFVIQIPRDTPYLGPLRAGEAVNRAGYVVRRGNRTIYPVTDRSLLLRITTRDGITGWGETYGIVAPGAVRELIADVVAPILEGHDPTAPAAIHDELYDLMRVRGYFGGFWLDALAAVDIALWDILGKRLGVPVSTLLGGRRHDTIPAYVSGLPAATLPERCDLARHWIAQGFPAVKFAAVVADDGAEAEIAALRRALGEGPRIMADLHWKNTAPEAIRLIRRMEPHGLTFAEAPCAPEDIEGVALVARSVGVPVALGEELRTAHEWLPRFERRCMGIAQPEMGRTGITEFARIGSLCDAFHVAVAPHATIGVGVFLAASLQVASTLSRTTWHEYQHSVFDRGRAFVTGDMDCRAGHWTVPTGAGLGVEPTEAVLAHALP
ncbi:mandelate racemase/muconate lactonizing enzyme family protein [Roseomonas sp. CCTCC AB2023176]|uniref:mandelate racemase/muconate lactonizing enzyme family protein n=1 Tax=Roseomonas sp. CCTCC AB2023176 TaxID=3342640 RepID=UPI0035E29CD5